MHDVHKGNEERRRGSMEGATNRRTKCTPARRARRGDLCLGLVGAEVKIRDANGGGAVTIEVLGYGSKDQDGWGKTAAELQKK
jgi:hypothetical protein